MSRLNLIVRIEDKVLILEGELRDVVD